jgi:integrase
LRGVAAFARRCSPCIFASLARVDDKHGASCWDERAEKELSAKCCKNIGGTLRKILATAVQWDILEKLPRFPKIAVADPEWDWFNTDETRALLSKARNPQEHALLLLPFDTGARAGEQLALQWGDVDWHSRKVVFRRAISEGILGPTKTGKTRHLPLTRRGPTRSRPSGTCAATTSSATRTARR